MKTIAILLSLSLAACATDDATMGSGLPPLGKPGLPAQSITADVNESLSPGDASQAPVKDTNDDGIDWVETIGSVTYAHHLNERLGVDEISILEDDGTLRPLRGQPTEIPHAGLK